MHKFSGGGINHKQFYRRLLCITEAKIVLYVGQLIYRKGIDLLLQAARELGQNVGFYLIGGKPIGKYMDLLLQNVSANVHFVDFQHKDSLASYYKAADVFVLPTREDVWGLVINEAMTYGLPIISTERCIAALELIEDSRNGFVIPTDDATLLKEKIDAIISDDTVSQAMGLYSRKRISEYTFETMSESHIEIFNERTPNKPLV